MLSLDPFFHLEIIVPFYSEHCVLHLDWRERSVGGQELQSLALGEVLLG